MRRIGDVLIRRNRYKPRISVPDPWHGKVSKAWKILAVIDILLAVIGSVTTILGIPFGLPIITLAITLLVLIQIGRHVTVQPEPAKLRVETPAPTLTRSCPECGEEIDDTPDACPKCSWTSDNPIDL